MLSRQAWLVKSSSFVMRDVAGARSGGYDKLAHLPDVASPPPFRFGRRRKL